MWGKKMARRAAIDRLESRTLLAGQLYAGEGPLLPSGSASAYAKADFNGDAKVDLVAATNSNYGYVYVMLGRGDASFTAPVSVFTAYYPQAFTPADYNGDGKTDLAFVNNNYTNNPAVVSTVSILLGNGDGTFQPEQHFDVGPNPDSLAVGDFNRDGKLDLAAGFSNNTQSGGIAILLGKGNGTFAAAATSSLNFDPSNVLVGDLNSDDKLDLFVPGAYSYFSSSGQTSIYYQTILLGSGTGAFAAPTTLSSGSNYAIPVLADFNRDSKLDLLLTDPSSTLNFRAGNGNGTFATATAIQLTGIPRGLTVADLNADGKLDVVVSLAGTNRQSVLLGNGSGGFSTVGSVQLPLPPVAADLNNDGKVDLFAGGSESHAISITLGRGDGTFSDSISIAFATTVQAAVSADLNGDRQPDIITANGTSNTVSVLLGSGVTGYASPVNYPANQIADTLLTADFNNDGRPDLATSTNGAVGKLSILLTAAGGVPGSPRIINAGGYISAVAAADLNGDGNADLIVASSGTYELRVLLGAGDGTFTAPITTAVQAIADRLLCRDFDRDGILDVVATVSDGSHGSVFLKGLGDGAFGLSRSFSGRTPPTAFAAVDMDADGFLDLVSVYESLNSVATVMRGRGDGTFQDAVASTYLYGKPTSITVADVDGDGKQDVLFGVRQYNAIDGAVGILRGNGDGTFQSGSTRIPVFSNAVATFAADVDRNGAADLTIVGLTGTQATPSLVTLLTNQRSIGAPPTLLSASMSVDQHAIAFTFDRAISAGSVAPSDLQLSLLKSAFSELSASGVTLSTDSKTLTFILPTTLPDGNYRFRIASGAILSTQSAGLVDDVIASGPSFFILAGDVNRDRRVDFNDLVTLAQNYNGVGKSFSQGNLDYSADGLVNFGDLVLLAQQYGKSLALPALLAPSTLTQATSKTVGKARPRTVATTRRAR